MAIALPYPDMDFVPLDILTAGELNQMVANIEFLANQFPVKSSNIDWNTIGTSVALTDFLTMESNFELGAGCWVKRIGNMLFGHILVHKKSGNFTSPQEAVFGINSAYRPNPAYNSAGFLKGSEWNVSSVCYVYMAAQCLINASAASNCPWAVFDFQYSIV